MSTKELHATGREVPSRRLGRSQTSGRGNGSWANRFGSRPWWRVETAGVAIELRKRQHEGLPHSCGLPLERSKAGSPFCFLLSSAARWPSYSRNQSPTRRPSAFASWTAFPACEAIPLVNVSEVSSVPTGNRSIVGRPNFRQITSAQYHAMLRVHGVLGRRTGGTPDIASPRKGQASKLPEPQKPKASSHRSSGVRKTLNPTPHIL